MNRHSRRAMRAQAGNIYIFFRDKMFYPLTLKDDEDARRNAEFNPGTTRVEDIDGNVIWRQQ